MMSTSSKTKLTKYFTSEELLPRGFKDTSKLDVRLLQMIDELRELLGVPCIVNNYATGGSRQWSGYRTSASPVGSLGSQHRFGRAVDILPVGMTAENARSIIRTALTRNELENLGGVKLNVSWLHVDVRPRVNGKVLWFRP